MITIPPRLRSGNPMIDVWAERMRRSLRTAMPSASNTVGISRTPQGMVHTSFAKGRRGTVTITGGGIGFTGKVWLPTSSGTRVLYLANTDSTKINVHVDKSGLSVAGFVEETNTPIPSSWGPDEFWYPKSEIAGSLIIP